MAAGFFAGITGFAQECAGKEQGTQKNGCCENNGSCKKNGCCKKNSCCKKNGLCEKNAEVVKLVDTLP
jgi:hypothetical protein